MSDDLVKRLLHLDMHPESAPRQAADRIEALEARAEKAEAERDEAIIALKNAQTIPAAWYEKLRVDRDALREALEFYVGGCDWQWPPPFCDRPDYMCCKTARAALKRETDT